MFRPIHTALFRDATSGFETGQTLAAVEVTLIEGHLEDHKIRHVPCQTCLHRQLRGKRDELIDDIFIMRLGLRKFQATDVGILGYPRDLERVRDGCQGGHAVIEPCYIGNDVEICNSFPLPGSYFEILTICDCESEGATSDPRQLSAVESCGAPRG